MGQLNVFAAEPGKQSTEFMHSLIADLHTLEMMIDHGKMEAGAARFGAEQELCMVDQFYRPAPLIMPILEALDDDHFTTELAKFNLEFNLDPMEFTGKCFSNLENTLHEYLEKLRVVCKRFNSDIILTGIVPTIRRSDLQMENMTPKPRYNALFDSLRNMRQTPFEYYILGKDELKSKEEYPTYEFCNTSFQVHYQLSPENYVKCYNFSKLITAPLLAVSTNSPLLFGKRLWHETRIALFQQAIDTRNTSHHLRDGRARVSFSSNWVNDSILEVFQDDITRFRLLLIAELEENSVEIYRNGEIPSLRALQIFNGTIYRWNRACYGVYQGLPHMRIENRILPAGPTVIDEVANTAFWLGMMHAMPDDYAKLQDRISFDHAEENFINTARNGLEVALHWLDGKRFSARELILKELLPIAKEGLKKANVDRSEAATYLDIIRDRVKAGQTGSTWILSSYNHFRKEGYGNESLVAITAGIIKRQTKNIPVHKWDLAEIEDAGSWLNKFGRVEQIMSRDLFTVQEDDLIELVLHMMNWKDIRHVPVEGKNGQLVGLITSGLIIKHLSNCEKSDLDASVSKIMIKDPIFISPVVPTVEAVMLMRNKHIGCLPIVENERLIGIITEHDFIKISARLLFELYGSNKTDDFEIP